MTNAQITLANAIKALEAGKLNSSESSFIEEIRGYSKKELANLTKKQYEWLRIIAAKNED